VAQKSLLLVDADPRSLRVLEVSLRKAGYSVATCKDGPSALETVQLSPPDLILSDTRLPRMNGFALVEALRGAEETQDIPFMFLSSDDSVESKVRGLELGVEDYLTKPIYLKEIITRINLTLQRQAREGLARRSGPAKTRFTGSLADMGLVDLLQTIDISRKSGVLELSQGDQRGTISFHEGRLVDAQLGRLRAEAAVYRLLLWNEGEFEVDFRAIDGTPFIEATTPALLMEGMRRVDEWGRLLEQIPPLDNVFAVADEELVERLAEIPDEINEILRHMDGRASLMEVVDACEGDDVEVLTAITKLYFEGIIYPTGRRSSGEVLEQQLVPAVGGAPRASQGPVVPPAPSEMPVPGRHDHNADGSGDAEAVPERADAGPPTRGSKSANPLEEQDGSSSACPGASEGPGLDPEASPDQGREGEDASADGAEAGDRPPPNGGAALETQRIEGRRMAKKGRRRRKRQVRSQQEQAVETVEEAQSAEAEAEAEVEASNVIQFPAQTQRAVTSRAVNESYAVEEEAADAGTASGEADALATEEVASEAEEASGEEAAAAEVVPEPEEASSEAAAAAEVVLEESSDDAPAAEAVEYEEAPAEAASEAEDPAAEAGDGEAAVEEAAARVDEPVDGPIDEEGFIDALEAASEPPPSAEAEESPPEAAPEPEAAATESESDGVEAAALEAAARVGEDLPEEPVVAEAEEGADAAPDPEQPQSTPTARGEEDEGAALAAEAPAPEAATDDAESAEELPQELLATEVDPVEEVDPVDADIIEPSSKELKVVDTGTHGVVQEEFFASSERISLPVDSETWDDLDAEVEPLAPATQRARYATLGMIAVALLGLGSFLFYRNVIMVQPADIGHATLGSADELEPTEPGPPSAPEAPAPAPAAAPPTPEEAAAPAAAPEPMEEEAPVAVPEAPVAEAPVEEPEAEAPAADDAAVEAAVAEALATVTPVLEEALESARTARGRRASMNAWRAVLEVDGNNVEALGELGWMLINQGNPNTREARPLIERALAVDPNDARSLLSMGAIHAIGGDMAAAREAWTRCRDSGGERRIVAECRQNL
jgi:DNA-binding response OmpR family regulator